MPRISEEAIETEIALLVQETHRAATVLLRTTTQRPGQVDAAQKALQCVTRAQTLRDLLEETKRSQLETWTIEEILRSNG